MIFKSITKSLYKIIQIEKLSFLLFILLSITITILELLNIYVISSFISFILAESSNKYNLFSFLNILSFKEVSIITVSIITLRCLGSFFIKSFEFFYVYRILAKASINYFNNIQSLDYIKILKFKPSKLSNVLMHEIVNLILGIFNPMIIIFIELLIAITLIVYTFIFVDKIFILVAVILLFIYVLFFFVINPINTRLGLKRFEFEQLRFNLINDNTRGIRHLKFKYADFLISILKNIFYQYGNITAKKKIIGSSSRYLLEFVSYIGIIVVIIISFNLNQLFLTNIVTLSIIAIRLIPSLNRIISEVLVIKFNLPVLSKAIDLNLIDKINRVTLKKVKKIDEIEFNKNISLENISFSYSKKSNMILKNLSLKIPKNKIIGITGKSGVGKTTLVNIICALLIPDQGKMFVDDLCINNKNIKNWRDNISLFSQDSFIFNGSIRENIIFGDKFNKYRLQKIFNNLNITEYIKFRDLNQIIDPYKTNLSGGQIQRILIARALYKNKNLYIFDEPTTNLDIKNKERFFKYLKNNRNTYVIISHDKEVLNFCDLKFTLK